MHIYIIKLITNPNHRVLHIRSTQTKAIVAPYTSLRKRNKFLMQMSQLCWHQGANISDSSALDNVQVKSQLIMQLIYVILVIVINIQLHFTFTLSKIIADFMKKFYRIKYDTFFIINYLKLCYEIFICIDLYKLTQPICEKKNLTKDLKNDWNKKQRQRKFIFIVFSIQMRSNIGMESVL